MEHSENRRGKRVKATRVTARKSADNLDELFRKFKEIKRAEGRAESTLDQYDVNYGYFAEFLDKHNMPRLFSEITKERLRQYVVFMRDEWVKFEGHHFKTAEHQTKGLSPSTINTRLKTLRVLFKCLAEEGLIVENPMEGVKNVNEPLENIEVLTSEELKRLMSIPNQRSYAEFRDYVLLHFMVETMCRVGETLSLREKDFDFNARSVTIPATVAKNRKSRILPLQQTTARLIKELIAENRADFDGDYIFLSNYGEPLTRHHFRSRLKKYARAAKIEKTVYPHLLRHSAATIFLESGGDLRHLQLLLGHTDLRVVIRYTHLSQSALRNQSERYSAINSVSGKLNKSRKTKR